MGQCINPLEPALMSARREGADFSASPVRSLDLDVAFQFPAFVAIGHQKFSPQSRRGAECAELDLFPVFIDKVVPCESSAATAFRAVAMMGHSIVLRLQMSAGAHLICNFCPMPSLLSRHHFLSSASPCLCGSLDLRRLECRELLLETHPRPTLVQDFLEVGHQAGAVGSLRGAERLEIPTGAGDPGPPAAFVGPKAELNAASADRGRGTPQFIADFSICKALGVQLFEFVDIEFFPR